MDGFLEGTADAVELVVPIELYEQRKWRMGRLIELNAPKVVIYNEAIILMSCFKASSC